MKKPESLGTGGRRGFMMSMSETAANKSLVQEFYDQVFSQADTSSRSRTGMSLSN